MRRSAAAAAAARPASFVALAALVALVGPALATAAAGGPGDPLQDLPPPPPPPSAPSAASGSSFADDPPPTPLHARPPHPVATAALEHIDEHIIWRSPVPAAARAHGGSTLLLNMLVRNEEENLNRTLPRWARDIDFFIIGMDALNEDGSLPIIQQHLGHLPGAVMNSTFFEGIGPTWDVVLKQGIALFPEATFGILADADHVPLDRPLQRHQLDPSYGKLRFHMWNALSPTFKEMDWIYRNLPGAGIKYRCHQVVVGPDMDRTGELVIDFDVEERPGGWQDRSGKKDEKYIRWLTADMEEYGESQNRLYFLGYSFYNIFYVNQENPSPEHWDALRDAVKTLKRVATWQDKPKREITYFGALTVASIYSSHYDDWQQAFAWYNKTYRIDEERADVPYYIGSRLRELGEIERSFGYLRTAATMPMPPRKIYHWELLYTCLAKIEFLRTAVLMDSLSASDALLCRELLAKAREQCPDEYDFELRKASQVLPTTKGPDSLQPLLRSRRSVPCDPAMASAPIGRLLQHIEGLAAQKRHAEAAGCYETMLQRQDDSESRTFAKLGLLYQRMGEFELALEAYQVALVKDADYAGWTRNNIAIIHQELGNTDQALLAYHEAIERRPDDYNCLANMGVLYMNQNKHDSAIDAFRRSASINPQHKMSWMAMGQALLASGRSEEAQAAFERGMALDE